MALPVSGPLSLNAIKTEFNGVTPIAMSDYYRGGAYVTANNSSVPTSGAISISNFYGASNTVGTTWTLATTSSSSEPTPYSIAYGNGVYMVVGNGTTYSAMRSTDGSSWTTGAWVGGIVNYVNGYFIVMGGSNSKKSTDGINWTTFSITASGVSPDNSKGIIWDGTNYITISTSTQGVLVSSNLSTWTFNPTANFLGGAALRNQAMVSAFGKIYALSGASGSTIVSSSNYGVSWSAQNIGSLFGWITANTLVGIAFNGTTLVVYSNTATYSSPKVAISTNGSTWTDVSSAFSGVPAPICMLWAQANWVISTLGSIYISNDFTTVSNAPTSNTALAAGYNLIQSGLASNGSGQVIAVGTRTAFGGYTRIIKSP